MRTVDVERFLGSTRPLQADRLLGSTAEDTFARVKAHSVAGCCRRHEDARRDARRKAEAGLAKGEPRG
jgi:hypothetical protein